MSRELRNLQIQTAGYESQANLLEAMIKPEPDIIEYCYGDDDDVLIIDTVDVPINLDPEIVAVDRLEKEIIAPLTADEQQALATAIKSAGASVLATSNPSNEVEDVDDASEAEETGDEEAEMSSEESYTETESEPEVELDEAEQEAPTVTPKSVPHPISKGKTMPGSSITITPINKGKSISEMVAKVGVPKQFGKGLGHTGPRRRQRDNLNLRRGISNGDLRRLARRGGVTRLSKGVYPEMRGALRDFLTRVIRDSAILCDYEKRKTISVKDVMLALQRQGRNVYGFESLNWGGKNSNN